MQRRCSCGVNRVRVGSEIHECTYIFGSDTLMRGEHEGGTAGVVGGVDIGALAHEELRDGAKVLTPLLRDEQEYVEGRSAWWCVQTRTGALAQKGVDEFQVARPNRGVKGRAVITPLCLWIGPLLEETDRNIQIPRRGCTLQWGMEVAAAKVRVNIWRVKQYTRYPVAARDGGVQRTRSIIRRGVWVSSLLQKNLDGSRMLSVCAACEMVQRSTAFEVSTVWFRPGIQQLVNNIVGPLAAAKSRGVTPPSSTLSKPGVGVLSNSRQDMASDV